MKRVFTHAAAAILGAAAFGASTGSAADAWRAVATQTDAGKGGAFVNVESSLGRPGELGVTTSRSASLSWTITCTGRKPATRPGEIVSMSVANAAKCVASANATTGTSGPLRLQLLRR